MTDEWNTSNVKPIVAINEVDQFDDGDVKDDWDASSESEKEEEVKPPPKPVKKIVKKPVEPDVDLSKMTSKEREAYQAQKEMEIYGMDSNNLAETFNELRLIDSKNVMEKAIDFARKVMGSVPVSEHRDFLLQFVMEASKEMPSKDQRHISTTLKTAADDKKLEEDKAKKSGAKTKKPATKIGSKAIAGDMFEDYTGDGAGGYDNLDDDFM